MAKNEGKIWGSSLKRKTPMKRTPFKRPAARDDHYRNKARSTLNRQKKPLAKVSKKHEKQLRKAYYPAQGQFLKLPENRFCYICLARSLDASRAEVRAIMLMPVYDGNRLLEAARATMTNATEVHHWAGRIGRLLDFVPYFVPECRECREWPHVHLKAARELDLIASRTRYDVFPLDAEDLWAEYEKTASSI